DSDSGFAAVDGGEDEPAGLGDAEEGARMPPEDHVDGGVAVDLGVDGGLAVPDQAHAAADDVGVGGEPYGPPLAQVDHRGGELQGTALHDVAVDPLGGDARAVEHPRAARYGSAGPADTEHHTRVVDDGLQPAVGGGLLAELLGVDDELVFADSPVDALDVRLGAGAGGDPEQGGDLGDAGGATLEDHGTATGDRLAEQFSVHDGDADRVALKLLGGVDVEEAAVDPGDGLGQAGHGAGGLALGDGLADAGLVGAAEPR